VVAAAVADALLPTVLVADLRVADLVAGPFAAVFFATGAVRATARLELVFAAGEVERDADVDSAVVCGALLFTAVFLRVVSFVAADRAVRAVLLGTVRGTRVVPVAVDLRVAVVVSFVFLPLPVADGRRLVVFLVVEARPLPLVEPRARAEDAPVPLSRVAAPCGMTWSLHPRKDPWSGGGRRK
jgi:hypothetical protein